MLRKLGQEALHRLLRIHIRRHALFFEDAVNLLTVGVRQPPVRRPPRSPPAPAHCACPPAPPTPPDCPAPRRWQAAPPCIRSRSASPCKRFVTRSSLRKCSRSKSGRPNALPLLRQSQSTKVVVFVEGARKQTEAQGAIGHKADIVRLAVGQHRSLHAPVVQVIAHLVGGQMPGLLALLHHGHGVVGDAIRADLARPA